MRTCPRCSAILEEGQAVCPECAAVKASPETPSPASLPIDERTQPAPEEALRGTDRTRAASSRGIAREPLHRRAARLGFRVGLITAGAVGVVVLLTDTKFEYDELL